MTSKIPIYVSNHKAYIWTVKDAVELREQNRICGTLVGTLPNLGQQNFFLGLPLLLMPEEVVLLVENEIAVLIDDSTAMRQPYAAELRAWDEDRRREVSQQIQLRHEREKARLALETGNRKGKGKMSEEAIQKRKEREERRSRSASAGVDGDAMSSGPTTDPDPEPSKSSGPQVQKHSHYTVHIPSTSVSNPWYEPSCYDDLASAKDVGLWMYPSNLQERASCQVFRYLWEKGYFLGSGIKFGGEFLVYPGDPLRYHSHFVASVLPFPTSVLRPMEIVAHGRLGTATKKAHLLCGWDEDKQEVSCFSIEWSGFG